MDIPKHLQSLLPFILSLVLLPTFSNSRDTISPFQSLREGETLISSSQSFALGFFSPGKSKNRYVGIWFNKIPNKTVVWVANRENPVTDSSGILTIKGGNLALIQGELNNTTIWSTNVSTVMNYSIATTLMDSGNLVLRDDQNRVLWESFDYPAHTWLPEMKIGLDRRTGLNRVVRSWKSPNDPAPGEHSFGLDPRGMPQYVLMKGSNRIWGSGPWNGKTFNGNPGMDQDSLNKYTYVANDDEIYFTYSNKNSSIISMHVLDVSGVAQRLIWNDKSRRWNLMVETPGSWCRQYAQCGAYGICDPNRLFGCTCLRGFEPRMARDWNMGNWSDGCVRRRPLDCEGKKDGFLESASVKLPDTSMARLEPSLSMEACKDECLKNCSCMAYAAANITAQEGSGCVIWYGELIDIRITGVGGQILYTRVAGSEMDIQTGISSLKKTLLITLPFALMVVGLVTFGYLWWKKLKGHLARARSEMLLNENDLQENDGGLELPMFDLPIIKVATNNFSEANMLGKGGFGPVYKGKLSNGLDIAVKRLSTNSRQGAKEFRNEVALIAKLQHKNLIRLLGYCIDKQENMLIYEYMRNKSLDTFIFDQPKRVILDWRTRFNIILGIARGVLYLHEESRLKIIHRDLKVSNVLLDNEKNPKISDFGIARIFGGEQTFANTKKVVRTYGYMSPEYVMKGRFSVKSDVYSFGVMLLEIISGRRNNNFSDDYPSINLTGYAWRVWNEGSVLGLVDLSIKDSCCQSEVLRCIQVGLLCVQENAKERPDMSHVVFMLANETTIPSPKQPAFCFQDNDNGRGGCSENEVPITELKAR